MSESDIIIRGAREHNLRNVNVRLPRNSLIVMTGVSGSGKSSLAFDTLYAEGQRRYVESLSSYARQFLGQMPKPEVDAISGLAPSISIQQKTSGRNPRSTVGTITEIYDYLRVLYARVGDGFCPKCGLPITAQTHEQILEHLARLPGGTRYTVLAPLVQRQKGEYRDLFVDLLKQGYLRARIDGKVHALSEAPTLDKQMRHSIDVVIDRLSAGSTARSRLAEAVEQALRMGKGRLIVLRDGGAEAPRDEPAPSPTKGASRRRGKQTLPDEADEDRPLPPSDAEQMFGTDYACIPCGLSFEPPTPQLFSFNSPQGMCTDCHGLGQRHEFDLARLIPDDSLSFAKGAVELVGPLKEMGRWRRHIFQGVMAALEKETGLDTGAVAKTAWRALPESIRRGLLFGLGDKHITFAWKTGGGTWKHGGTFEGIVPTLLAEYGQAKNPMRRRQIEKYLTVGECSSCGGTRLNQHARSVRLTSTARSEAAEVVSPPARAKKAKAGARSPEAPPQNNAPWRLSLAEVCGLTIADASRFFEDLQLDDTRRFIAGEVLKEIRGRLGFLRKCGLDYLTLDRSAPTLSGGESQRIRLAGQIGCGLVGVVYILDEPSIGLHPRDNQMLLDSLLDLRDLGNTVIVVEHDEDTMRAADHIVDFGPGPGVRGGLIVAEGSVANVAGAKNSVTGQYLSGRLEIAIPARRRGLGEPAVETAVEVAPAARRRTKSPVEVPSKKAGTKVGKKVDPTAEPKFVRIVGASHNNLKNVTVDIPLGRFVCVTGASGSGKSSLINDILWQALLRDLNEGDGHPGRHERIDGFEHLDKAIDIDQSPIGRTPRSNPATYIKLFDLIRDLYTQLPESKLRGYKSGRFSFNVSGGRCEACEGHGSNKLEMDFLADVWVTCPVCEGRRFNHETLEVRFKGKSISEVLDMDVQEALVHFENVPKIVALLKALDGVGLDYLKLGQPSPTLSGGEAQRIKLARELGKRSTGKTIYLLDEPTTGLHFADIHKLLDVLHGFVDQGNTVLVVEHNLDVIKTADWVIDLGPDGGAGGGRVLVEGTPETVAACAESYTGRALKPVLARKPGTPLLATAKEDGAARSKSVIARPIVVKGAGQHNLKQVDIELPRHKMSVFCGPSGSGKTSLAMDTLYAEGQRRYVESLSSYARQFLGQMPKPKVEHVSGLSPAIAIEQKTVGHTPRSTVGTVTEIHDYLRILWARLGEPHCPECDIPVRTQTTDEVIERLLKFPVGTKLLLLAPLEVTVGQDYADVWTRLAAQGYRRVRVDGTTWRIEEVPELDRRSRHQVEIVVDRVNVDPATRGRLAGSVESALDHGRGWMRVAVIDEDVPEPRWRVDLLSLHRACSGCGRSFEDLTPHSFSFNSPLGWCGACEGLGVQQGTNLDSLVHDPLATLANGAISAWPDLAGNREFRRVVEAVAAEGFFPLDVPFRNLDPKQQRAVLYGTGERWIDVPAAEGGRGPFRVKYKGLYPALEEATRTSVAARLRLDHLVGEVACSACHGSRLRNDAGAVRFQGRTIQEACETPLGELLPWFQQVKLKPAEKKVAGELLREVTGRLSFLVEVGLDYLTLSRTMPTLSGGESQRIRLAGQVGRALTGVLYVLDEPTIGLHPRDNARLLRALTRLRDLGNTVVLVEHDREVLEAADRLYDFGPGAGRFGGTITGQGKPAELKKLTASLTGKYLAGTEAIPVPSTRRIERSEKPPAKNLRRSAIGSKQMPLGLDVDEARRATPVSSAPATDEVYWTEPPGGGWIEVLGARHHNLHAVDLRIPLGTLTCVTGVSGSGKSSLIQDTLARAAAKTLHRARETPGTHDKIRGLGQVNKVIEVDQQPLGSTPASNPATYTGVFEGIRELFARLPDAKVRGFRPSRFSFNRPGGRCETCEGNGQKKIEMHFLADVWVPCDDCGGKRFNSETLTVKYHGNSIADVLEMSVGRALELFENVPAIRGILATLAAVGLDYLTLGQSAATLSGGEAQRVKLAAELARPQTGRTLYLLDEPTTGLHFVDIKKLLKVLDSLVELGNTVVVIEHNLDVIKTADWVVDLGPEAGREGGRIVAQGTPEHIVARAAAWREAGMPAGGANGSGPFRSYTGELLAPVLEAGPRRAREVFDARAAARKQSGDVSLADLGKDAKMPWEVDGRGWHTRDRLSHQGRPCQWEGAALEAVIDALEADGGFQPTNWGERAVVEVTGKQSALGWFVHAMTGNEWLVSFKFRVPPKTFSENELADALDLKTLNEIDEIPAYSSTERVQVRKGKGPFQEVLVAVHWEREVRTPAFQDFLKQAIASYHRVAKSVVANPVDKEALQPWRKLGLKWHILPKGFDSQAPRAWDTALVARFDKLIAEAAPSRTIDFSAKTLISYAMPSAARPFAVLQTKRPSSLGLSLIFPSGRVRLGMIADLGLDPTIETDKDGYEIARLNFVRLASGDSDSLVDLVRLVTNA
jgi:excinuclease ABC subunit A